MAENGFLNLFSLSYDATNGMKKKDLVDHIENLKGKVVVGNDIQGLFDQISKLSENVDRLVTANDKLNSELLIVRNVNQNLQNRIINLEKQQSKSEQYNRRNNVEISGISNVVSDQNLEETVIGIFKDSGIDVYSLDIEGCHRLPLERNATNTNKRVIMKFVNRKHSEAILPHTKDTIKKSKVFVSHSLCPYYRFLWEKCEELQRNGRVNQVFCLGAVVTIRITENSLAIKVLQSRFSRNVPKNLCKRLFQYHSCC